MANEQNLRPIEFQERSVEEHKKIASKGGSVKSPAKKYAAKIREMRKRSLTNDDVNWFLERIEDPETNVFHLQQWLDEMRDNIPIERQRTLLDTAINLHKAHHGEKIKQESQNVNINVNMDMVKFQELQEKYETDKSP